MLRPAPGSVCAWIGTPAELSRVDNRGNDCVLSGAACLLHFTESGSIHVAPDSGLELSAHVDILLL